MVPKNAWVFPRFQKGDDFGLSPCFGDVIGGNAMIKHVHQPCQSTLTKMFYLFNKDIV